jgi:hypothetical protein
MNESSQNRADEGDPELLLTDLASKTQLSNEQERRCAVAARAAYAIDLMRREHESHGIALLPLDLYLRGLAEFAGVSLDEVLTALELSSQDRATAPLSSGVGLLARVARLIGLTADETQTLARMGMSGRS